MSSCVSAEEADAGVGRVGGSAGAVPVAAAGLDAKGLAVGVSEIAAAVHITLAVEVRLFQQADHKAEQSEEKAPQKPVVELRRITLVPQDSAAYKAEHHSHR